MSRLVTQSKKLLLNQRWINIAAYIIPIAFFAVVICKFDSGSLLGSLQMASIPWMALALFLGASIIIFKVLQWNIILGKHRLPFRKTFRIAAIREMAEQIFPMRTSMGVNLYCMGIKEGVGKTVVASSLFVEELAEGGGVILLFGIVAALCELPEWMRVGILSFICIGSAIFLISWWFSRKVENPSDVEKCWPIHTKIKAHLKNWLYHMHSVKSLKLFASVSLMAFIIKIIESITLFVVAISLGLNLPLASSLFVVAAINVAAITPVTPGNYGFFEGAAMLAFLYLGMNTAEAFSTGLIYHLTCSISLVIAGYIATIGYDWRRRAG